MGSIRRDPLIFCFGNYYILISFLVRKFNHPGDSGKFPNSLNVPVKFWIGQIWYALLELARKNQFGFVSQRDDSPNDQTFPAFYKAYPAADLQVAELKNLKI